MRVESFLRRTLAASLLALTGLAHAAATITIVNGNGPGQGFNDPTPVAPVGGNPGMTLGQQRLNVFQYVASLWGATIDSRVEILILSTFEPLPCTVNSAVLGSAGPRDVESGFPNAPVPGTPAGLAASAAPGFACGELRCPSGSGFGLLLRAGLCIAR